MNYADFKKKVKDDKSFAAKFKEVKNVDALVKAAAAEGYIFTADEVKSEKLTIGDLDNVAGGSVIVVADWFAAGSKIVSPK